MIFLQPKNHETTDRNENDRCKNTEEKESFEKIPCFVAALACMGFYVLLFLGYLSQLVFPPKVAKEKNRPVIKSFTTYSTRIYVLFRVRKQNYFNFIYPIYSSLDICQGLSTVVFEI